MSDEITAETGDAGRGSDLENPSSNAPSPDTSTAVEPSGNASADASTPVEGWNHHGSMASKTAVDDATHPTHNTLSRAWYDFDAYLFDIDGTLMHCRDAVHYFAFCDALSHAAGRPVNLDGVPVQGKIDPGILRDAFERAGVPESTWRPLLPELLDRMGTYVEAHEAEFDIQVLPGVPEALLRLRQRSCLLGVGTGNLERIGWAKLRHCGLRDFFTFGGFSDRYENRADMITGAVAAARVLLGKPAASVLVLGDTPGDIAAARAAGVEVIAIASGIYNAQQLAGADLVLASMLDLVR